MKLLTVFIVLTATVIKFDIMEIAHSEGFVTNG